MHQKTFFRRAGLLAAFLSASIPVVRADDDPAMPRNLGRGLRQLAAWHVAHAATLAPQLRRAAVSEHLKATQSRVQTDAAGRVVVDVYLNGAAPSADVRLALENLGATVLAVEPAGQSRAARNGVISAYLPVDQAAAAARLPGVQSVSLVHKPWHRVGAVTSQGVATIRANYAQIRHFTGAGITVGAISDSYNRTLPSAATDVLHDDLPGPGNPAHRTTPVVVLQDGNPGDSDEGRALLQVVHDVAPNSKLAFMTSGQTQAAMASAIRSLRTDPRALCDIIVDDIGFSDEPMFSDGIISQAVEDVVTSSVLAGRKVIYYSAAGNEGDLGYEADFSQVSNGTARAGLTTNNLKLNQVPTSLTGSGFHNFTPGAVSPNIAQKVVVGNSTLEINFQWNDLFDASQMTSDFNMLVFDQSGNYLGSLSGVDDNFSTGQALEIVDLDPNANGSDATYQIAIARTSAGAGTAQHFRYITSTNGNVSGTFWQSGVSTVTGHAGTRDGDGVGAHQFNRITATEEFSSCGPVTIYFDAAGNRLATPEVRQQPTISAPDGVATTIFNPFYGTSAAAPHAAGAAALILQATGGPGSTDAATMRSLLENTSYYHDLNPFTATAQVPTTSGTVSLTAHGDDSNFSSADPQFFTLNFNAPAGSQLAQVSIDISPPLLKFDPTSARGFPFTVGQTTGGVSPSVTARLAYGVRRMPGTGARIPNSRLVLTFSSFPAGGSISFGIDRDLARTSSAGNNADQLVHSVLTTWVVPPLASQAVVAQGAVTNSVGYGYTPADGFGVINVNTALRTTGH